MGSIVLFDSVKGGVGKSTLLAQFAVGLSQNFKVAVMDCDPQQSIETWAVRRFSNEKFSHNFSLLEADIEALSSYKKQFDFVLIDSAGADTETGRELLLMADVIISPLQATQAALDTVPKHFEVIEQVAVFNPKIKVFYLLNDCSTHAKDREADEAKNLLADFLKGKNLVKLIPDVIYSRKVLKTSYSNGGSCFDLGKNKSKDEILNVIGQIFGSKKVWKN
ncbi:ParA family protein [Bisgaard Taxon 10/6]|uniref:ParA family protein n=1 Tax=Exercitatus varius TaxID=67857 RepID=UPI00294B5CA2|nr:ParA family protein [Exercitatus varius]MDG2957039.1 ParA family protein [Exercitatus varius]MDG2965273.1 ParA family protein [Exercitatus varius]